MNISIIVPCFNCSRFLTTALDSLRVQSLQEIEFICINDGSIDGTLDILQDYKQKDNRFKIINKHNTGYGDSVNIGISNSKGKYVAIFEPDDFVEPGMYNDLFTIAENNNLDIVKCCYYDFNESTGDTYNENSKIQKNTILCPRDNMCIFLQSPTIWNAIYRKDFLLANDIWFLPTPGAAFQDTSFHFKTNLMANRYFCTSKAYYHYRSHDSNSVKSPKYPYAVCTEFEECARYGIKVGREPLLKSWLLEQEFHTYKWNYIRLPPSEREKFIQHWRSEWLKLHQLGYGFMKKKLYLYLYLLLNFPKLFIYYLEKKSKQESKSQLNSLLHSTKINKRHIQK